MIEILKLDSERWITIRIWRVVIYLDWLTYPALRFGGIVCNFKGKRVVANHIIGRFSFITTKP